MYEKLRKINKTTLHAPGSAIPTTCVEVDIKASSAT